VGSLRSEVSISIPPRRYATHIALASSIFNPYSSLEEVMCNSLMDDDVWVDPETTKSTNLQMEDLGELHRD